MENVLQKGEKYDMARNDTGLVPTPVRNVGYGILGLGVLYVGLKVAGVVWSVTTWVLPVAAVGLVGYGGYRWVKNNL